MNKFKINLIDAIKINKSKKTFIVFETDKDSKIIKYILTEDLHRHYHNKVNNFRLLEVIKKQLKTVTI
jgi:hypothetical protein